MSNRPAVGATVIRALYGSIKKTRTRSAVIKCLSRHPFPEGGAWHYAALQMVFTGLNLLQQAARLLVTVQPCTTIPFGKNGFSDCGSAGRVLAGHVPTWNILTQLPAPDRLLKVLYSGYAPIV